MSTLHIEGHSFQDLEGILVAPSPGGACKLQHLVLPAREVDGQGHDRAEQEKVNETAPDVAGAG